MADTRARRRSPRTSTSGAGCCSAARCSPSRRCCTRSARGDEAREAAPLVLPALGDREARAARRRVDRVAGDVGPGERPAAQLAELEADALARDARTRRGELDEHVAAGAQQLAQAREQ